MGNLSERELAEITSRPKGARLGKNHLAALPHANDAMKKAMTGGTKPKRDYKAELLQQLALVKIAVTPEFKIFPDRRFRADWRVDGLHILIEYEGGLFHKGKMGHDSVTGILRDIEKANLCTLAGWVVIRIAPSHIENGIALNWIERAIANEVNKLLRGTI